MGPFIPPRVSVIATPQANSTISEMGGIWEGEKQKGAQHIGDTHHTQHKQPLQNITHTNRY